MEQEITQENVKWWLLESDDEDLNYFFNLIDSEIKARKQEDDNNKSS